MNKGHHSLSKMAFVFTVVLFLNVMRYGKDLFTQNLISLKLDKRKIFLQMHYLRTGNKLLECTCCKQSGKRKPQKKGFTKTASRHVSSKLFSSFGRQQQHALATMISLIAKKFVFFLLEWPYKESLKLISQGTQLLYI